MYSVNENYLKLPGSYLFSNIAKKLQRSQQRIRMHRSSVWESVM